MDTTRTQLLLGRTQIEKRPQVEARTGLSRSAIYAAMAANDFPRPLRLTAKAVGWRSEEIDQWINSRQRAAA
jgi:prophage regulatory protein